MSSTQATAASIRAYALEQVGGPYIMGATAEKCTPKYRRALAEGRSKDYADKITAYCPGLSGKQDDCDGCKWQGMIAHDCAQLTRHAAEAAGLSLPSGATSQWQEGAWAAKGLIGTLPPVPPQKRQRQRHEPHGRIPGGRHGRRSQGPQGRRCARICV